MENCKKTLAFFVAFYYIIYKFSNGAARFRVAHFFFWRFLPAEPAGCFP
jgi:hypothetical protein